MSGCVDGCSSSGAEFAATCPGLFDEFLACMARNGLTCPDGTPTPAPACDSITRRIMACGGGSTPPMPGTDAGVAPRPDV